MSVVQSTRCDRCGSVASGDARLDWFHVSRERQPLTLGSPQALDFCTSACIAAFFGGGTAGQPARVIVGGGGGAGSGIASPNQTGGSSPVGFAGSTYTVSADASRAVEAFGNGGAGGGMAS